MGLLNRSRAPVAWWLASAALAALAACQSSASSDSSADAGADATAVEAGPDSTAGKLDAEATEGSADAGAVTDGSSAATDAGDALDVVDSGPFSTPGADASVVAFDATLVCFGSGGTGPCSRTVDKQVAFPTTGAFKQILMHVTLECPSNGCDPWDRAGSIDLVQGPASDGGAETLIELGRFITPYGINAGVNTPPAWDIDVTELRPLLSGTVTLRVFIDTWVPQGNAAQYGGGWVVGATFQMTGGFAARAPEVVLPIWSWTTTGKEPTQIVYGDPASPIAASVPPQTLNLPAGPTAWGVRSIITGHGQANLDNCAEFCSRNHSWTVGSSANAQAVWRTDCASFPSNGTYQYPRAGWCPGAFVIPWDVDVTSQVHPGAATTFTYGVDPYLNTCNASGPDGGVCTGCAGGVSCAYDGSGHTQPFFYVSSLLIGFR